MKEIERAILDWLQSRNEEKFKWVYGGKVLGKDETIRLFKKDKKFRKLVVTQAIKAACDLFMVKSDEGSRNSS